MRDVILLSASVFLLAGDIAAQSTAPAPIITSTEPAVMLVTSRVTMAPIRLVGKNFWPSGPNDPNRWRIHMRRDGGAWAEFRGSSGNDTQESFSFPADPWLKRAGRIEVRLTRDGVPSNIYSFEVRATAPALTQLSPEQVPLRNPGDDKAWTVFLRGQYWVSPTTVYINGQRQSDLYQNLYSGMEDYVWPAAFRRPGRYAIHLQTEHGKSSVKYLDVVAPPTSVAAVSPKVTPAELKASTRLDTRIRFAGSVPASVEWRSNSSSWRTVTFGTNIRMDEALVTIPTPGLDGATWLEVKLKNIAGEGVARIEVDRTQLARSIEPQRMGAPSAGSAATARVPGGVMQPPPVTVPAGTKVGAPARALPTAAAGTRVGAAAPATATPAAGSPAIATPAAASPAAGIVVQGGRGAATAAAPAVVTPAPVSAAPAGTAPAATGSGLIVQGGRTATAGIVVQGGRTAVDTYRSNLQTRLGSSASRVTATMQGTTLVLTGTVPSEAAKQSAAQAATGVAGVTSVRNELRVAP